ncbi:MAG: D-glycerate dehydrogenase [Patescibacteria group bacterium]
MSKIYLTRKIPNIAEEKLKEAGFDVTTNPEDRILSKGELISELKRDSYDAVLCLLTDKIDAGVFDAVPTAKIFSNYAVGYNNIDIEEAKKRGIVITNTPGVLSESVAEHTFALLLAVAKRIVEADRFTREGKYKGWAPELLLGVDLFDKNFLLLGAGRIGTIVARIAKGFGMKVFYFDIKRNEEIEKEGALFVENVEDGLKTADFVSIHLPLLDSTKHFLNKERLALLKKTTILVNTSRGPIVDEEALAGALLNKKIGGAGLDVYENEPDINENLKSLFNVVLTPHTASATLETRGKMAEMAAGAIVDFLSGVSPKNKVF